MDVQKDKSKTERKPKAKMVEEQNATKGRWKKFFTAEQHQVKQNRADKRENDWKRKRERFKPRYTPWIFYIKSIFWILSEQSNTTNNEKITYL
jgi:hypothetical protein